jgi:hypothetical protein
MAPPVLVVDDEENLTHLVVTALPADRGRVWSTSSLEGPGSARRGGWMDRWDSDDDGEQGRGTPVRPNHPLRTRSRAWRTRSSNQSRRSPARRLSPVSQTALAPVDSRDGCRKAGLLGKSLIKTSDVAADVVLLTGGSDIRIARDGEERHAVRIFSSTPGVKTVSIPYRPTTFPATSSRFDGMKLEVDQ